MGKTKRKATKPLTAGALSRRQFIADTSKAALLMSAFDTIWSSLANKHYGSAFAATTGIKNFLHINFYLSPPRWMYDLILNPHNQGAAGFMPSPQVSNVYTGADRYTGVGYQTVQHTASGIQVPYLMGQMVPTSSGSKRVMSLLDHMISIRGIDVLNAAHQGASQLHQAAVVGAQTITSLTSDRAERAANNPIKSLIPAFTLDPNPGTVFNSLSNMKSFRYNTTPGNNLSRIFGSMTPISTSSGFSARFMTNKSELQTRINSAIQALEPQAKTYYSAMLTDNKGAMRILTDEAVTTFNRLANDWDEIFNRYKRNINQTLAGTYAKINDKPIGEKMPAKPNQYQYSRGLNTFITNKAGQVDLRETFKDVAVDRLAASFAVTEFLMLRQISPSISFSVPSFQNLRVKPEGAIVTMPNMVFDQHYTGCMLGVYMNSMYYLSFSSCLLELVSKLQGANLYNQTLIYMASEFNRAARFAGDGADHGSPAASVSLLSGLIPEFKLIGNILRDSAGIGSDFGANYKGTWGHGANIPNIGRLSIQHVWGSILRLLGEELNDIPNAVPKSNLIFNTPGSFAFPAKFNVNSNINNASKS